MKVEIPVEADTTGLRQEVGAAVAALSGEDIDIDVEADTAGARAETQAFVAATQALDAQIDVDADTTGARAEASATRAAIDAMSATIEVKVDVDRGGLAGLGGGGGGRGGVLGGLLGGLAEIPTLAIGAGTAVSSFGQTAIGAFGAATGSATGMLDSFGGIIPIVGTMIASVLKFGFQVISLVPLVGTVLSVITAAIGAVGAAVSGLPALLLGVGAAAGVVALGMDGIKKAAQAAVPGLNQLKEAVSTVFEKQLTPIFRDLGERVFPQLTLGLQTLATHVGGFAAGLLAVATTKDGIADLNAIFQGMGTLLQTMMPSWQGLLAVFLEIGATSGVWRVLGEIISSVVNRVAELFARFAEGGEMSLMIRSLNQFKAVLDAALGAINELILGATEFFTGAGPGLRDMFRSIEETLKKIDFESLGQSFGSFARTVGQFIENIPQSTWDAIANSVQRLAEQFAVMADDPAVQEFFNNLIGLIPLAVEGFRLFLVAVQNTIGVLRSWTGTALEMLASVTEGINTFVQAMPFIPDSVKRATGTAAGFMRVLADDFNAESARAAGAPAAHAPAAAEGGRQLGQGAADGAAAGVAPMAPGMGTAATEAVNAVKGLSGAAQGAGNEVGTNAFTGARTGIAPMSPATGNRTTQAIDEIVRRAGAAQTAGNQVGTGAFEGAKTGIAPMPGQMGQTTNEAKDEVGSYSPQFANVGRMIIEALARAILGGASSVISAAASVARQAIAAAKAALGIASPSKVFRYEVGPYIPEGLALGITDNATVAAKAVTTMVAGMLAQRSAQQQSYALGQTMGEQIGAGLQTAVGDAFAKLPDVVKLGTVSEKLWDQLLAAGWKGRAGDGMEALYRPGVPQVIKHLDRVVSAGRGALMNKVWHDADGPTNATPQTDIVKALQNGITWRIELDPEGVAQLSAQGARSLERR